MGLLVGFLYYGVSNSQVSVQDRTGALYFVLTTQVHIKKNTLAHKKNSQVSVPRLHRSTLFCADFFFVLTTQIFSAQASLRVFLEDRDLFLREHMAGAYRTSAYYWAKSLADTPLQLLNALLFSLLGYVLVRQVWSVRRTLLLHYSFFSTPLE